MRLHYLDVSRGVLMVLGIPFHAALVFSYAANWSIVADEKSWAATLFSLFSNIFRMPSFFMVAGFFSLYVMARRNHAEWFKQRSVRLLVPFFFGMMLLNPIQILMTSLFQSKGSEDKFLDLFYDHIFSFGVWWIRHLWFLLVLFCFCLVVVFFRKRFKVVSGFVLSLFFSSGVRLFLFSIFLCLFFSFFSFVVTFFFRYYSESGVFSLIASNFFLYLPFFLLGSFFSFDLSLLDRYLKLNFGICVLSVFGVVVYFYVSVQDSFYFKFCAVFLKSILSVTLSQVFFSVVKKMFDRKISFIDKLVRYSFSIYLIHQPLVLFFGFFIIDWALPPFMLWIALSVVVFIFSWLFAVVVSRYSLLRFMFNGER